MNESTLKKYLEKYDSEKKYDHEIISKAQYDNIFLTNNPKEICDFMGLNYKKWINRFNTKKDIFDWIIDCKWFNKNSFRALDYAGRNRAHKRTMYIDFLKYIFEEETDFEINQIEKGDSLKYVNFNKQLDFIELFNKTNEIDKMISKIDYKNKIKIKFNGKKLLDLGISEKNIKEYKNKFHSIIETKYNMDFDDWIYCNSQELINNEIIEFINN